MITSFFQPKTKKKQDRKEGACSGDQPVSTATSDENSSNDDDRKRSNPYLRCSSNDKNRNNVKDSNNKTDNDSKRVKKSYGRGGDDTNNDAVLAIVSSLKEDNEEGSETSSTTWKVALSKQFSTPSFNRLANFVQTERQRQTIYPPPEDVFTALNLTPLSKVKLVIVGQDPYHGPRQAHGLCFSIRRDSGVPPPPSLKNIYKELINDPNIPEFTSAPNHGCLDRWARQGVLMINTVLTVRKGEANSHKKKGWEEVTDAILRAVRDRSATTSKSCDEESSSLSSASKGVVFLLWGKPATEKTKTILNSKGNNFFGNNTKGSSSNKKNKGTNQVHSVIATSHPSPLGATKTNAPFLGSKCFSRANDILKTMGHEPIDWRLDEN